MKSIETMRWVEDAAKANSTFQIGCADVLDRQASVLLNLLLAGAGGALAYAVNLAEKQAAAWQQVGMAGTAIWLFLVAGLLLVQALWNRPTYGPANDPENLQQAHDMALVAAIAYELENRQFCITANRTRNNTIGRWLNICRCLAAATPLIFLAVAVFVGG